MTVFIFLALYLDYHHCLVSTLHGKVNTPLISNDICDVTNSPDDNSLFCVAHGTASDMNSNNYVTGVQWSILNAVFDIAQRLLMLAADVELNSGPVDNIDAKHDNLLQAVALSERRVKKGSIIIFVKSLSRSNLSVCPTSRKPGQTSNV